MKPKRTRFLFLFLVCLLFSGALTQVAFAESWVWPVPSALPQQTYLSGHWGDYYDLSYYQGYHWGIDIWKGEGAEIVATMSGTVVRSFYGDQSDYTGGGHVVVIQHSNDLYSHYCHMSGRNVSVGDTVVAGQVIGWMGSTGSGAGGRTHLHFAIKTVTHGEEILPQ